MVKYNKKILVTIVIIFIVLIILGIIGLSLAWFSGIIQGNENANNTVIETANLKLLFNDTQAISMNKIVPGANTTKTFTVENIGTRKVKYDINIIDVINTFLNNEFIYSLTSTNNGASITNTPLPTENATLINAEIEPGITQVYTMEVKFIELNANQNYNRDATFKGKLQINAQGIYSDDIIFTASETVGTINVEKSTTTNIIGTNYGNVSCESADTSIADCTSTQKSVTIMGKSRGTTNITIKEDTENLEITYTITVVEPSIYNKILSDNTAQSDVSIDFSAESSVTNGRGLYYTADNQYGEDGERIYYYRGRVDNNWVSFGGFFWRIVRTTSEGGVRLAYSGDGISTTSAYLIAQSEKWHTQQNNKYYVGYTFNTDLNGYSGTQTNSNIKTKVDTWYDSNINASNATYLSDTAIYCNDRSNEREINGYIRYPVYDRLICTSSNSACYGQMSRPTFACPSTNQSRYSVSTSTGNGYLQKPIALLNADEINYAGLSWDGTTSDSYIRDNTSTNNWWLMSPAYYETAYSYSYEFYARSDSTLNPAKVLSAYLIRGAVSLKSCITVSGGNGSKETPYVVSNASC